ncbi:hypothetical protein AB0M46_42665 [Dactylosporangium sp. NPDC051485]|uniref:hypothetical protein n=1 Tax=Dactylosporangium sp. NPDC051485 TaxID=3154846 RepID=UPI003443A5C0
MAKILHCYAWTGCLTIVPFVYEGFRLPWYGTAAVVAAALLAWSLMAMLIRPGAVIPPLPAIWAVAAILALFGTGSLMLQGTVSAGALAAGGYGWALAVVTLARQRRYRAAVRSAAPATMARSSGGSSTSTSGPRASSWL